MTDKVSYVYLRVQQEARHSQIDFDQIEQLAGEAPLQNDIRDPSVYFFALPEDIDEASANRIISALVTTPHIDEAWKNDGMSAPQVKPLPRPK